MHTQVTLRRKVLNMFQDVKKNNFNYLKTHNSQWSLVTLIATRSASQCTGHSTYKINVSLKSNKYEKVDKTART